MPICSSHINAARPLWSTTLSLELEDRSIFPLTLPLLGEVFVSRKVHYTDQRHNRNWIVFIVLSFLSFDFNFYLIYKDINWKGDLHPISGFKGPHTFFALANKLTLQQFTLTSSFSPTLAATRRSCQEDHRKGMNLSIQITQDYDNPSTCQYAPHQVCFFQPL